MSDVMLLGVLRMPLPNDPAKISPLEWVQFRARAREAASRIEADAAEIERLRSELRKRHEHQHEAEALAGHYLIQRDEARQALAEERERCAQVALAQTTHPDDPSNEVWQSAYNHVATQIAAAIRGA